MERRYMFGLPHIGGARYVGGKARLEPDALCAVCGRMASNAHHIVPKGMGGGSATVTRCGMKLKSPLIAVCGFGNCNGCHGEFHSRDITAEWVWYTDESRDAWEDGSLLMELGPHNPDLYLHGMWVIEAGGHRKEITS